jgi:Tfp pilus assembly major pilin PilA
MEADRPTRKPRTCLRDDGGYSLVELMVAIGVAAIVGMGIYAVFNYSQRSNLSQRIYNDMQTGCNFAMDQMKAELMLAGYRARDQVRPISAASGNAVTFEYYDDNARDEGPYAVGYDNNTQVTYRLQGGELLREMKRHIPGGTYDAVNVTTQTLASNVASLSFGYFANNNLAWDGADVKDIRTIRPTLVCNAARPDPNTKRTPQITLTAEVRARNVGVASTATDVTPPEEPKELIVWDPGDCGTLQLRWKANTEADLEGYTIFYGLASGAYSDRLVIARAPKVANSYEYYTVTGLDSSITGVTPRPQYWFALNAFDKSGNISLQLSTEASGDPATSARTADAAAASGSDSTITPRVPDAPPAFTATPGNNSVTLSWTASPVVGLVGYRLYRSRDGASFTPVDPATGIAGNRIANETALNATAVSFTDTGLLGCTEYYYKLAAIACDTKVPIASMAFASATGVPLDNTPPPAPIIAARPGFRRIILTLTNPVRSGPGAVEDFSYTKIFWSKVGIPVLNADGSVTPDQAIPRSSGPTMPNTPTPPSGTFSLPGSLTGTVNFNDETSAAASAPNLSPDTTYYFRAVTYDLCGNHSTESSQSVAEGTQCGDCLLPAPAPPGTPDPACYGAPPVPDNVGAQGCYGYVDLSWTPINDIVVRDFQGYRLLRREGSAWDGGNAATEVSLTGADAAWLTTFRDASVLPGRVYSYKLMATDCYYEQHHGKPSADWPEAGNNPDDNFSESFINDLAIGQLDRDEVLAHAVTGYLLPSVSTLPMTVSPANGLTSVPPDFQHNTLTFWAKNTAACDLSLQEYVSSWENPLDFLQQFAFGDEDSTAVTIGWQDTALPLSQASVGSAISMLPNSRLRTLDDKIPVVTTFKNADGSVTRGTDARQQSVDFTMYFRNESTKTDGCQVNGSVYAPLGPYLYGTTQDQPSAGTRSWPVPGDQGSNSLNVVAVAGGTKVNVFANVFDSSGVGLAGVKLYYYVDGTRTLTAAPAVSPTAQYPNFPPYTAIDLAPVAGNQWRTPVTPTDQRIPANAGSNIWYFIVAVDNEGNFDREPEIGSGAFQYRQVTASPCETTPNAPPSLTGVTSGGNVTLSWAAPLRNTDGSVYADARGFRVYRNRGEGWTLHYAGTLDDPAVRTFTDAGVYNIEQYTYQYYVTAVDTCLPSPRESLPSEIYTETAEGPCNNTPAPPVLHGSAAALPDRVTLVWTAPTANAAPSTAPLTDLAGFEIWRQANAGAPALLATVGPTVLTYQDDTAADIKNVMYSYYVKAFDSCTSPAKNVSVPSNTYTEPMVNNPCDETPNPATLSGSTNGVSVTLAWVPPTHDTNGELFQDGGGFKVYRSRDGGPYVLIATTDSSTLGYTDTTVAADIGTAEYSYFVVVIDTCNTPNVSAPSNFYTEGFQSPCATIPGAVTGLTVSAADATGVSLSWAAPTPDQGDLAGYEIERRNGATGTWTPIIGSPLYGGATTVKDKVTDAGTQSYFYRVRAFDSCGTPNFGAWSAEVAESFDPCSSALPNAPTGLTATASDDTGVYLSWSAPSPLPNDIAGYEIEFQDGATGSWIPITESPTSGLATSVKQVIGTAGTHVYSYRVRAFDLCATKNFSPWSSTATESYVNDPCGTFPVPYDPLNLAAVLTTGDKCVTSKGINQAVKAELSWKVANPPVGVPPAGTTRTWEFLSCDTGATCTPTTPLVPDATPSLKLGVWSTTVTPGDFLKARGYVFGVRQVYTNASCRKTSATVVVADPCP